MRKLLLSVCILTFFSCGSVNKENERKANQLIKFAESSSERLSELPLGFKFGMSQAEIDDKLSSLVSENAVSAIGDLYFYDFHLTNGETVKSKLNFSFYDNELYRIILSLSTDDTSSEKILKSISDNLNNTLDLLYKRESYYVKLDNNFKLSRFYWVKGNQIILLNNGITENYLSYINAPVDKIVSDNEVKKVLNTSDQVLSHINNSSNNNSSDIKNSSWDGSVSQVKRYLEQNLVDPDSYEGVEWSEVMKEGDNYVVRHKYRAKNSFGGYVIENKVFYLNSSGTVVNVKGF